MENFYTPLNVAKEELLRRRNDKELKKKVEDFLQDDIPDALKKDPKLILWRSITTPDNEVQTLIEMSSKTGIGFIGFEHVKDKFVSWNLDKYSLMVLHINNGKRGNGSDNIYKMKIIDVNEANGKTFDSIETLFGNSLVEFHHDILLRVFPDFKGKTEDISDWVQRHGARAKYYYDKFLALLICHGILVENFEFQDEEGRFTRDIFYPAYMRTAERFGVTPLIVKLAPDDFESKPSWWYYAKYTRELIRDYIKMLKEKNV